MYNSKAPKDPAYVINVHKATIHWILQGTNDQHDSCGDGVTLISL